MPRPLPDEERAMEVVACAAELERIAVALARYDRLENMGHQALRDGKNVTDVVAALLVGDEQEKQMLDELRRDAAIALTEARRLAGRISASENQMLLETA